MHKALYRTFLSGTCIILLLSALFLAGCGKKAWPEPVGSHDAFAITRTQAKKFGRCLIVTVLLDNNADNVKALFLETTPDDCPGCPVANPMRTEFSPAHPDLVRDDTTFTLTRCSLNPLADYRWRVILTNTYRALRPVQTPWQTTAQTQSR